ncbi:HAD family phosphatase [Geobacillus sp. LEMMY01]|uniref:HAD family hydrolase n=1 Tax=Geobacillus sp. LEMMY01 TaxID=1954237 RepID=UPI001591C212|nr:HAD family hydrolase [Geobacillus sp. LEMMY01]
MKAIIFDFDGLIVDTETAWFEAYKEAMNVYGMDLPLERFVECVGSDNAPLYEFVRQQLGENCNIEEIEAKAASFYQIKMKTPQAREGVKDYLEEAKQLGYKIAIASSSRKEWVIHYLNKLGLLSYFEVIMTSEDVEKIKPAPDLYQKALAALDVRPDEAVVFEDSLNGLQAALAAGVKCVIVPNPVTQSLAFEQYDLRLNSMAEKRLAEVIELIEGS